MSTSISPSVDSLVTQAMTLTPEEQIDLAERLWMQIGPMENEELFAEIDRRDADVEAGAVKPIPYEQAMREIRDSLK
jgi:putative addiction module component (TIGR02574 family)